MIYQSLFLLLAAAYTTAHPAIIEQRAVTSLNQEATAEAQRRDNGATRAVSSSQIRTSDNRCLFVDELSGDFRANLTPIQVGACNGNANQLWDVITAGVHNNVPGNALIVSSSTQACFNFDPRRAAGNQALLFSCGGRADGDGKVTDSQLFPFTSAAGPVTFSPKNAVGTCFTVKGNVIDQAACQQGSASQTFTFGAGAAAGGGNGTPAKPALPVPSKPVACSG